MVDASITDADRERTARRLRILFVLLVGASGGLVALQADPTPAQLASSVVGALFLGALLTWYLGRILPGPD